MLPFESFFVSKSLLLSSAFPSQYSSLTSAPQIPGFLTPVLVSWMTGSGSLAEWYRVFSTAGLVYTAGGLAYLTAGTSELQVSFTSYKRLLCYLITVGLGQGRC